MVTSLYSEPIPVTEITSDWRKFHFPRDSRVITCVNLNLDHARGLKNSLHAVFTRYLCGNHVRCIYGNILKYTVNTGVRCSFWWWGVVVSSSFVCGALAFLIILSFSLRALSSRLVRAP